MRPWLPFTMAAVAVWSIAGCSTQTSATDESGAGTTSAGQNSSPVMEPPSVADIKFDGRTPPAAVAGYSLVSDEEIEADGRALYEQRSPVSPCGITDIGLVLDNPTSWLSDGKSDANAREAYAAYYLRGMDDQADLNGWGEPSFSVVFYSSDWDSFECIVVKMARFEGSPQAFVGSGILHRDKYYSAMSSASVPKGDTKAVLEGVVDGLTGPTTTDGIYFAK